MNIIIENLIPNSDYLQGHRLELVYEAPTKKTEIMKDHEAKINEMSTFFSRSSKRLSYLKEYVDGKQAKMFKIHHIYPVR